MPKLTVDGIEVEVPAGATVMQACEAAGKEIPRFCYHERLSIAGNCRMCLVEMDKAPKPIASCAMPAGDNMVIKTDSPLVRKARQGVMEFLLINHPLDCPICDQGGECDLQDQAMTYGRDSSRFAENKRAVADKNFGPLIKTFMNRCIHCTRCVRFLAEVAGAPDLGAIGRGEHTEISAFLENPVHSELSGNLVDLCPVGALTSKPYAYSARPWELRKTESIDVLDAVGANIRVDVRGGEVMRVLPRLNEAINEEWLADKSRYAIDGLKKHRLDRPYVRKGGALVAVDWAEALAVVARRLTATAPEKMAGLVGDLVEAESVFALKQILQELGVGSLDCRIDGSALGVGARAGYLFNSTLAGLERADVLLLIGANPRWEAPLANARLRKRYLAGRLIVGALGPGFDLTYPVEDLGKDPRVLDSLLEGTHPFAELLNKAKNPALILGMGALARPDGAAQLAAARGIAETYGMVREDWNGFNVLQTAAGRTGALDLGFLPQAGGRDFTGILAGAALGEIELVYLLGADFAETSALKKAFVIYQGHHGDRGAAVADVILPGAAYTEKDGTYVNLEGRAQRAFRATFPVGEAREDWKILRALSALMGKPLPFDTLAELRGRLERAAPNFAALGEVVPAAWGEFGVVGPLDAAPYQAPVIDYYRTDPISRASETMAKCSALFVHGRPPEDLLERVGTYG